MVSDIKSPGIAVPQKGIGGTSNVTTPAANNNLGATGASEFGEVLKSKVPNLNDANVANQIAAKSDTLKFSQHAIERMASRGISLRPEEMLKLNEAVEKAAQKGSKESLVIMGDNALIVSVKNKTVVTAMDRQAMRENVFTNIDSTVIL